ncbi:MAG: hypothetical protein ABSF68_01710 [Candidatus Acidiferrales bacterium]|jgi:hypothetical protein
MTRSGSLAYYLTAWICGCFFMSLSVWTKDLFGTAANNAFSTRSVFGLIFFYFYGLVFGAIAALTGAFLLRRVMAVLKCMTASHWAVAGAILAPAVIAILGLWGRHVGIDEQSGMRVVRIITFGPKIVVEAGWWLAIPAGAATAYLLCRVQRAFGAQHGPQAS